jgi:hypothetical protein
MSFPVFDDREQLRLLRGQIAELLSENVALQQQVAELEREKAEMGVDSLTAALVRAVRLAEEAIAIEAIPGQQYVISQFEAALNGVINVRDGNVVINLPQPNQILDANKLGRMQINLARTPAALGSNSVETLRRTLEEAQAIFSGWSRKEGATRVQDLLTRTSYLLSIRTQSGQMEFLQVAQALAQVALLLASELPPSTAVQNFRVAATQLAGLLRPLLVAGRAESGDLAQLATALEQLTHSFNLL